MYLHQGGTLDVIAHEILADGRMKEIYKVTGGAYGGIYVDEKFEKLLENLFGIPVIKEFRIKYPAEWIRLMNDFELKKRARRAIEGKVTRVTLPRSFLKMVSEPSNSDKARRLASSCNIHDVEIYNGKYLCLGPKTMKNLFHPVVNGIVSHIRGLFSRPALKNVSCLFMVGGFAESVILQEAVKTAFSSRCSILVPNYAGIAVVQGATMFGQRPPIVTSRLMNTTYGFGVHEIDPKVHPLEKMVIVGDTVEGKDVFQVIVKENDVVKVGERMRFTVKPAYSDQKKILFKFYASTNPNVKYITDASVSPFTGMVVNSPDISKGQNRDIELSISFGGTELKATAIDMTSGNVATVYLDFLR